MGRRRPYIQATQRATLTNKTSDLPSTLRGSTQTTMNYTPLEITWTQLNSNKYFHTPTLFTVFKMKSFIHFLCNQPLKLYTFTMLPSIQQVETFRTLIVLNLCLHENKLCNITLNCLLFLSNKWNETLDAYQMPTDHKLHVTFSHSSPPWWHSFVSNFLVGYLSSADWTHENKNFTVYFRKTNSSCFFYQKLHNF